MSFKIGVPTLPSGYTQLEYIQTLNGNCYIDTGIKPYQDTKINLIVKPSNIISGSLFGAFGLNQDFSLWVSNQKLGFGYGSGTALKSITVDTQLDIMQAGRISYLNGIQVTEFSEQTFEIDYNLYIGNCNRSGGITGTGLRGCIYSCKIWRDGITLNRHFVPAKRNSDSVVGMYDLVSQTFFSNASTNTFIAGPEVSGLEYKDIDSLRINNNGSYKRLTALYKKDPDSSRYVQVYSQINPQQCLCFTANTAGSTVAMAITGTPTLNQNFQTSIDNGSTWQTFTPGTTTITLTNINDKVLFKGCNPNGVCESGSIYYKFVMTGSITGSGNIMSLIDGGSCNTLVIPNDFCFEALFANCASLTTPPELPATVLSTECYERMFQNCTGLLTAPVLPALTASTGCYMYMFQGCTELKIAPALPATTLATSCYLYMFAGCTGLTTVTTLPATTLANNCYYSMFQNCTSLVTAQTILPATELPTWCYYCMFYKCTALETAPVISATTMSGTECCAYMFGNCSSLITPPSSLLATTLTEKCYYHMFSGCTALATAPTIAATTITGNETCYYMFGGCTLLTTPPPSLSATTLTEKCYQYMFYNCYALQTAPAIAATTLALSSCEYMFWNCTSLTTAPALYFTNLVNACYAMFGNCTALQVWSTAGTGHDKAWRIPATGTITTAYEQDFMFYGCAGTRSSDHLPGEAGASYTYYTQNTPV